MSPFSDEIFNSATLRESVKRSGGEADGKRRARESETKEGGKKKSTRRKRLLMSDPRNLAASLGGDGSAVARSRAGGRRRTDLQARLKF